MKKTVAGIPGTTMPTPPSPHPSSPKPTQSARATGVGRRATPPELGPAGQEDAAAPQGAAGADSGWERGTNPGFIGGTGPEVEPSMAPDDRPPPSPALRPAAAHHSKAVAEKCLPLRGGCGSL